MKKIAIIGLGYSGLISAYEILQLCENIEITIYDRSAANGAGIAYNSHCNSHALNVVASKMSAIEDKADDFTKWLLDNSLIKEEGVADTFFAKRQYYGKYLLSILVDMQQRYHDLVKIIRVEVIACNKLSDGYKLTMADGRLAYYDAIILANGNTYDSNKINDNRYITNPWDFGYLEKIKTGAHVVIIGTGLTLVDIILGLQEKGYKGKLTAMSRHGLLPTTHQFYKEPMLNYVSEFLANNPNVRIMDLFRIVKSKAREAVSNSHDWRNVIDSLRPYTQKIWLKMDIVNQKRFLRHVRAYWDILRHRIAPDTAKQVKSLIDSKGLITIAGRLKCVQTNDQNIVIAYQARSKRNIDYIHADYLINATGISQNPDSYGVLFKQMLADGLIRWHENGFGLAMENDCLLSSKENVYAVGPLTRAYLWESIAVPDIRKQAKRLALQISDDLHK